MDMCDTVRVVRQSKPSPVPPWRSCSLRDCSNEGIHRKSPLPMGEVGPLGPGEGPCASQRHCPLIARRPPPAAARRPPPLRGRGNRRLKWRLGNHLMAARPPWGEGGRRPDEGEANSSTHCDKWSGAFWGSRPHPNPRPPAVVPLSSASMLISEPVMSKCLILSTRRTVLGPDGSL